MLDDLVHRVLLHVLHEGELRLAGDVELEHRVGTTQEQRDLVAGQCEVHGVGAVAVEDGRDLPAARRRRAKPLPKFSRSSAWTVVVFRHGYLLAGGAR